jgi:hypothetical protein
MLRVLLYPLTVLGYFLGALSEGCLKTVPNKRGPYNATAKDWLYAAVAVALVAAFVAMGTNLFFRS